jgi:hypothetical protein
MEIKVLDFWVVFVKLKELLEFVLLVDDFFPIEDAGL